MINLEVADILNRIAEFLEMEDISFRSRAYRKVARLLEFLEKDIKDIYQEGGLKALEEISGVGQSIALKIEEYIKTGKIKDYDKLKKRCPVDLDSLTKVEGLGAKKIKVLYKKLNIKTLKDLEKKAKVGKIRDLEGFGEKSEENILQGIAFAKANKGRFLLGSALPIIEEIIDRLEKLPQVDKISMAG